MTFAAAEWKIIFCQGCTTQEATYLSSTIRSYTYRVIGNTMWAHWDEKNIMAGGMDQRWIKS